jgi:hypothetical protein
MANQGKNQPQANPIQQQTSSTTATSGNPPPASTSTTTAPSTTTATSSSTATNPNVTTITLGSEVIEYDPNGASTSLVEVFFKKADRAQLQPDKLATLFEKATKTQFTGKFDLVSPTFNDEDKLDDTYNIGLLINRYKNHLLRFDMFDVFNIVIFDPKNPTQPMYTMDLTENYSTIDELTVANSCKWYRVFTVKNYYRENLQLSTDSLETNSTPELWEKCA